MKLEQLLKIITHQDYKVFVQNTMTMIFDDLLELKTTEDIKNHFEFTVLCIDKDWNIIVKGE